METTTRYSEYNLPMSFATIDMIPTFDTTTTCHMRGIPISCAETYMPAYIATSQELDVANQHGSIMYYPEIMDATFGSMVELLQGSDLLRPYPPAVMDENVPTTTLAGAAVSTDFYPAMTTTVIAPSLITPSSSPMVQNISHISMLNQPNVTYHHHHASPPISPPPSPVNTTTVSVAGFPFDHAVPRVVPSQPEIPIAPAAVSGSSNTIVSHSYSHSHSPYPQPSVLSTRSNGRIPRIQPMKSVSGDKPKPKRTPDGKKPLHHCPEAGCNRTFTRSFNLRSHLNTHTNSRPYACTHCSWAFVRRHDLDRHVKSRHLEHKPFSCPGCGMQFGRSDALRRHLRVEKVCERRVAVNRRESV